MLPAHLHVRLVHVLDQGSLVQVSQRIPWWSLSRSAAALGGLRGRRPRAQGCRRKPLAGLAASALRVAGSSSRAAPPAPVSHHRSPSAPEAGEGAGSRPASGRAGGLRRHRGPPGRAAGPPAPRRAPAPTLRVPRTARSAPAARGPIALGSALAQLALALSGSIGCVPSQDLPPRLSKTLASRCLIQLITTGSWFKQTHVLIYVVCIYCSVIVSFVVLR